MDWQWLFFSFHGRINRAKYWLTALIFFIAGLIMAAIGYALGQNMASQIVGGAFELVIFISGLAVVSKRLHDRGRSAWWLLLFYLLPGVLMGIGFGVFYATASMVLLAVLGVIAGAITIWAFVEIGCLRGTIGSNRYGSDPLAGASSLQTRAGSYSGH